MLSYATTTLVFLFFCSCPSSAFIGLNRYLQRDVCYDTDTLLSFQYWIDDSVPYCSSILSISDSTVFTGATKTYTTTTSTITRTSYDSLTTVIQPQATITASSGETIRKRQGEVSTEPLLIAPEPIAVVARADNQIVSRFPSIAQNASIAAEAYSACSCLRITFSTVTTQPTITETRTIKGVDYEGLGTTTATTGTTTLTSSPLTSYNGSLSSRPFPTLPTLSISAGIFPSANGTGTYMTSGSGHPTAYPTQPSSGFFHIPTVNLTTNFNASRTGRLPLPIFLNGTGRPLMTGFPPLPTLNGTNRTLQATGSPRMPLGVTFPASDLHFITRNATSPPLSPVTGTAPPSSASA